VQERKNEQTKVDLFLRLSLREGIDQYYEVLTLSLRPHVTMISLYVWGRFFMCGSVLISQER